MLKKHAPVYVNTHFNHPKECTYEAYLACKRLADAGCVIGNQSVLLKGVNDDPEVMKELMQKLLAMRVRPYYIYQCDLSQGISHFRTSIESGSKSLNTYGDTRQDWPILHMLLMRLVAVVKSPSAGISHQEGWQRIHSEKL